MSRFFLVVLLSVLPMGAFALDTLQFTNPEQQVVYETLTSELRCLVCQNQTIGDSNAELAADLRRQVYEMLQQGKSKQDILQFMTDRYGDFVLYNPPLKAKTSVLWLGPVIFLVVGLIAVILVIRRKKTVLATTPDSEASAKLAKIRSLLDKGDLS
jgi:cytochrome c-type biogenesis protein CcmH